MATDAPRIGGRYVLGKTLGRGGMARVYRARDTQLDREVAVKLMRPDRADDPVFEARFLNEARNASAITHPNVVRVLDFGTDGPGPYLVMELVEGGDLAALIAEQGPLPPHRAVTIAAQVASAIHAAHRRAIVHRDVKPGNILLGADGRARVADFGISRAAGEQTLTGTGTSLGTVDYFSPEQARGEPATAASDIYALGVVLYEMLTGKRPFRGETPYAVAVARIEAPPPDPRSVRPDLPKPLATVVQRAMAVDPAARYASAAKMGRALRMWLARHPAPAPIPVAAPPRAAATPRATAAPVTMPATLAAARSDRRRAPVLLAAAAVLLLAVIGFVGGRLVAGEDDSRSGVVVGTPRGAVFDSTPDPTVEPTPSRTPTASPTPRATPAPIAAATPVPATPAPPPATPAPTPVMVAMAITPDQTLMSWYAHVVNGEFDAAYALWSDRMKSSFPRQGNLDNRWRDTASVDVIQLYVTSQTASSANVFIEFVETKDNGTTRRFVGSWDLVRSGDAWLLDQPYF